MKGSVLTIAVMSLLIGFGTAALIGAKKKTDVFVPAAVDTERPKDQADERLGQYVINMMFKTSAAKKISDARKQILARTIVRVANDIFETEENKKAFIAVLAIESHFDRFAQSPTGPKGIAQVAKAAFNEALADCGVSGLHADDVWDMELNLYAGACYFKKQLDVHKGDPYIAIVAYNQGPNSSSVKNYAKHGQLTELEPLKYVAKFSFLKRTTTAEKTPNVPALKDLPKPQAPVAPK